MNEITDAFEDLSHALRVLLEANIRAHRHGLIQIDRAEAVGNIETALASVLNAFHSLYDATEKLGSAVSIDWYGLPELATILILRNARHHNHAKKVRTLYSYYVQEADHIGSMEMYVLLDFPAIEEGADTFEVYLSWADLNELLKLPQQVTRIRPKTEQSVRAYLNARRFKHYAEEHDLEETRVFFNLVPLIVNAAITLIPQIKDVIEPRSMESETYLTLFQNVKPADTKNHKVECGPIALMP